MKKEEKKELKAAIDTGGPPPELREIIEQSFVTEELKDHGGDGDNAAVEATDAGSAPPHLVAEIENGMSVESSGDDKKETVEDALDGGPCPPDVVVGIQEMYVTGIDDDDDANTYDEE